jgi:mRNA-degrading endonuclease toxin of MazEF toxin-antitoxin module
VKRGEIWLVDLDKRRPALVFRVVPWLHELHIVPITSVIRGLPSEVEVPGMPRPSVANAQRIMLVTKDQVIRRVGTVPAASFEEITLAVCTVLGC